VKPFSALPERETGTATKKPRHQGDPVSYLCQAENNSLKEKSEWREVYAQGSRRTTSFLTSPSQVPLYNRYKVLDVEGQSMDNIDDSPPTLEVSPRSERPTTSVTTTSMRKKR